MKKTRPKPQGGYQTGRAKGLWQSAILIGASLMLTACGGKEAAKEADPVVVEVVRARGVDTSQEVLATGSFRREKEIDLSFRIGGVLREINFREGQLIAKGALVASLDPTQVNAQITQAVEQARVATSSIDTARAGQAQAQANTSRALAGLSQAQADMANAQRDFQRDEALAQKGFISEARLDTRRTRLEVADANVRAAKASVAAAQEGVAAAKAGITQAQAGAGAAQAGVNAAAFDRRWARLIAPAGGLVLTRLAEPGEIAGPGQPILVLADEASPLILRTPVSDRDVAKIKVGDKAQITISALSQVTTGVVRRVAERADPRTGAFDIDIAVPAADGIKTGFFAQARIQTGSTNLQKADQVLVPAEALIGAAQGKASLYVLNPDQKTVRLIRVDFLGLSGNEALVRGLPIGAGIVTSGGAYISDKARVTVVEAAS